MKKNIISIILIFALLFVTACNKEKKDAEESTEPIISDIPTEIPDNDQIKDKKTGAIFGVDREIKGIQSPSLTDADSVQIILNQSTYYFPFVFSRFDNEGWTYFDNQDKPIENIYEAIDGEESVDIVFRNNDSSFIVKRTGFLAESSGLAGEPIITDIVLQGSGYNASFSWILPGGITEKSTAADVLSIFGDPNNTKHFSSESGNTERSLIYKSENNTGISYIFNFDVDGRIETVEVSKSDKEIANTVKYSNELLTIQLPGFWQGRYVVKKEGDDTYQFKFKEGGHLFSIMISETEVYDYSTNSFVIGALTGNNHHYEVACRFPTDDQAPEGYEYDYNAMNTPLSPSEIFDSIEAADMSSSFTSIIEKGYITHSILHTNVRMVCKPQYLSRAPCGGQSIGIIFTGSHRAAVCFTASWESHPRSLRAGHSIRKYHCPLYMSSHCREQFGIRQQGFSLNTFTETKTPFPCCLGVPLPVLGIQRIYPMVCYSVVNVH